MMKKGTKEEYVPDRLFPPKKEILEFCDKVLAKWKMEPETNSRNIIAMTAVKTSVFWTDEESLKAIWGEILKWAFELMYKNAIVQAKEENSQWSPVLEKSEKKERSNPFEPDIWY